MSKSDIYLINQNTKAAALKATVPSRSVLFCDNGTVAKGKWMSESLANH